MTTKRRSAPMWLWLPLGVIGLSVAGAGSISTAIGIDSDIRLIEADSATAAATVEGVDVNRSRRSPTRYAPEVSFIAVDGNQYSTVLPETTTDAYDVGDIVTIRYSTADPTVAYDVERPASSGTWWLQGCVLLFLGLAALAASLFLAWSTITERREQRRKLAEKIAKKTRAAARREARLRDS